MVACISSSRQAAASRTCAWMVHVPNPNSFSAPTAKLRSVHQRGPLENKIPVVGTGKEAGPGVGHAPSRKRQVTGYIPFGASDSCGRIPALCFFTRPDEPRFEPYALAPPRPLSAVCTSLAGVSIRPRPHLPASTVYGPSLRCAGRHGQRPGLTVSACEAFEDCHGPAAGEGICL
ncbi:uncharacterized protein LOC115892416 [Rhinopithecus roxellana]|uniref:uncharacterized protein LOC115892416 n=1 Tax=Rhinopithecus roxellana TaxID=61622 RepID=UPI0012371344|nr:uncharacterized protein LOC115892416 [Rhinopithecus roxellana]